MAVNNDNLERLNQLKSCVSERDVKIWENVAYTECLKKETEKLENETERMKKELAEKKKENKLIEEQLEGLSKTLDIQRQTLRVSERSAVLQKSLNETLANEANEFKKKYDETLKLYNEEFEDYRAIHENASKSYQELKVLKVQLKKLQVEKMILDKKIADLEESDRQYRDIQEKIFHTTMVKLAEYYILYHKNEEMKKTVQEKKKQEQALLKEHFRLAEEVKQKMKQFQSPKIRKDTKSDLQICNTAKEKESDVDKLKKFLSAQYQPCSFTKQDSSQHVATFNQDKSKVKILDTKIIQPPILKSPLKKNNLNVREKIENIMEETRKQALRTNSFKVDHIDSKKTGSQSTQKPSNSQTKVPLATESQSKFKAPSAQTNKIFLVASPSKVQMGSDTKFKTPLSQTNKDFLVASPSKAQTGSQTKLKASRSQNRDSNLLGASPSKVEASKTQPKSSLAQIRDSTFVQPPMKALQNAAYSKTSLKLGNDSKNFATTSILKSSQEKEESVSKFFAPNIKRKTVTFQNETNNNELQGHAQFQMFSREEKPSSGTIIKDMNIFQKPFAFKNELFAKTEEKNKIGTTTDLASDIHDVSFPAETGQSNFATYGDSFNKSKEEAFELHTSFNAMFEERPENVDQPQEPTTFSFFNSQNNCPFGF